MTQSIWTEETSVRSFETDFEEQWKPACFFQAMQEAATHHAASFGFDYQDMLANNMIWVLSRMLIRFERFPRLRQKVVVTTWPKGLQQKIFFTRDFIFAGPDGERFATATSAWLLIDPSARRMLHPRALQGKVPDNEALSAMDEQLEKINPGEDLPERLVTPAAYSAVDLMGHVNNARYIEWISDSFPMRQYQTQRLSWLQINYLNEVKPGECVSVRTAPKEDDPFTWLVDGLNQSSNQRAFEAALGWVAREGEETQI